MDPLIQSQEDFQRRLEADAYFADISVLLQRRGVTEADIEEKLNVLNEKGGKLGACAIVLKPRLVPVTPDAPGPEYFIEITVQVLTQPLMNDGDGGTGKQTEAIATRTRILGHNFAGFTFFEQQGEDVPKGKDSYSVTFRRRAQDNEQRCGKPLIDPDSGAAATLVTLTSATAGATIYYTTDGSLPTEEDGTLYAGPFAAPAGRVRAIAYKDGLIASDVAEAAFV
jgi:hypothetical protein